VAILLCISFDFIAFFLWAPPLATQFSVLSCNTYIHSLLTTTSSERLLMCEVAYGWSQRTQVYIHMYIRGANALVHCSLITHIRQIGQNLFWSSCGLSIILTCSCLPTWASRQTHSLPIAAWPEVMQTNCVSTLYLQSISWIFGGPVTASLERPACFEPLHSLALLLLLSIQCNFIIEAWKNHRISRIRNLILAINLCFWLLKKGNKTFCVKVYRTIIWETQILRKTWPALVEKHVGHSCRDNLLNAQARWPS